MSQHILVYRDRYGHIELFVGRAGFAHFAYVLDNECRGVYIGTYDTLEQAKEAIKGFMPDREAIRAELYR